MRIVIAAAAAAAVALAACGGSGGNGDRSGARHDGPTGEFPVATVILDGDDGVVMLEVEVAETAEQRARGLMGRKSLPDDGGMLFMFFEETSGGFWMKDTLIPLSIAFFDADGRIVEILDMEPCEADPCPIYDPGVPYWGALEVDRGSFSRWGVSVGDEIDISR